MHHDLQLNNYNYYKWRVWFKINYSHLLKWK